MLRQYSQQQSGFNIQNDKVQQKKYQGKKNKKVAKKVKGGANRQFGNVLDNRDISKRVVNNNGGKKKEGGLKNRVLNKQHINKKQRTKQMPRETSSNVVVAQQSNIPQMFSQHQVYQQYEQEEQQKANNFYIDQNQIVETEFDNNNYEDEDIIEDVQDELKISNMSLEESLINLSLEDIDEFDKDDPMFVSEYVEDIFAFLRKKEREDHIPGTYMENQSDLKPHHRFLLIEWMQEVYYTLSLKSETLFLAVHLVDRVLSLRPVSRSKLQLVAVGTILIAAKYEELWAPHVKDLRYTCDYAFKKAEILKMERILLNTIDFNLGYPCALHFLRRFSKAGHSDSITHTLSKYFCELSLTSYDMLNYLPSQIGAAAVYLSRRMRNIKPYWNSNLRYYTHYEEEDVLPCAILLNQIHNNEYNLEESCAIRRKYMSPRLYSVSNIPPVEL